MHVKALLSVRMNVHKHAVCTCTSWQQPKVHYSCATRYKHVHALSAVLSLSEASGLISEQQAVLQVINRHLEDVLPAGHYCVHPSACNQRLKVFSLPQLQEC